MSLMIASQTPEPSDHKIAPQACLLGWRDAVMKSKPLKSCRRTEFNARRVLSAPLVAIPCTRGFQRRRACSFNCLQTLSGSKSHCRHDKKRSEALRSDEKCRNRAKSHLLPYCVNEKPLCLGDNECNSSRDEEVTEGSGTELESETDTHSDATSNVSSRCVSIELESREVSDSDRAAMDLCNRIVEFEIRHQQFCDVFEFHALCSSVEKAFQQRAISKPLEMNLLSLLWSGDCDQVRDVLYHKCHLKTAVRGKVLQNSIPDHIQAHLAKSDASFVSFIDHLAPVETEETKPMKVRMLKSISDALNRWIKVLGYEVGLTQEQIAITQGALFLAGSYRLGLHDPDSDIDVVCAVPYHVSHRDFFCGFSAVLTRMTQVTELVTVPNASVPLISLSYQSIKLDLLFAQLPLLSIGADLDIHSDHILAGVSAASVKSLNAPRVSSMILSLVPNRQVFRRVSRAIRAWARRRGIYSSKLGYLSGINWALLTAFVCQLFPGRTVSYVFVHFFYVLSEWQWPKPIMLNIPYDAKLGLECWSFQLRDRTHVMPIITPAYPQMNSSAQVTASTLSVIKEELWRARDLLEREILSSITSHQQDQRTRKEAGALEKPDTDTFLSWDVLYQPSSFFVRYDWYVGLTIQIDSSELGRWETFVCSRLHKLVKMLQDLPMIDLVHGYPQFLVNKAGSSLFLGLKRRSEDDEEFLSSVNRTISFFIATDLQQNAQSSESPAKRMQTTAVLLNWDDLPDFVFENGNADALQNREHDDQHLKQLSLTCMGSTSNAQHKSRRHSHRSNLAAASGSRKAPT
uniref:polynucleotide adenylyltransferase n=1 Tax=Albugo laibachii Nc14 TaxID=890382 RepID=F0WCX5_9STRA|nr:Poly(A) polymerase putative [Albugo laibachii Nc14]|eukprot:CCA19046.1 Poly(A) polymerase putative [Albugo laibachii Nc14]